MNLTERIINYSMENYAFEVNVPATSANLGVCFDFAGVEIPSLYNTVYANLSDELSISLEGLGADEIPRDSRNVIYQAYADTFAAAGKPLRQVAMHCINRIPLNRGLGSSSSAILSGIELANQVMGGCLTKEEMFQLAAKIEGHPDNVAPAIFGGIVISAKIGEDFVIRRVHPGGTLYAALAVPDIMMPTSQARAALPKEYSRTDVVAASSMAALAVDALQRGDFELLGRLVMLDVVHQPYRKGFIKGYDEVVQAAVGNGAFGACISGAGSTLIAFCPSQQMGQNVCEAMCREFERNGISAQGFCSKIG